MCRVLHKSGQVCFLCQTPKLADSRWALLLGPTRDDCYFERLPICNNCWADLTAWLYTTSKKKLLPPAILKRRARRAKPLKISSKPPASQTDGTPI